jgi:prolipoprotein diacylglyceryltransferase
MESLAVYPTQLFESFANLIIFAVLLVMARRVKIYGHLFLLYLILYSSARFLIEFLRGDVDRGVFFNAFSMAQLLSVAAIIFGIYMWSFLKKRGARPE